MRCEKCGYESSDNRKISLENKEVYLCSICSQFAPGKDKLPAYLQEKLDWKATETFRKHVRKNISSMQEHAREGRLMSRAAFGYKIVDKELVVEPGKKLIVEDVFRTFLNQDISLTQLAKNYNFSVNGIKKLLKNFTYIGKIKFSGQILQGKHPPLISNELFNKVQTKLENLD